MAEKKTEGLPVWASHDCFPRFPPKSQSCEIIWGQVIAVCALTASRHSSPSFGVKILGSLIFSCWPSLGHPTYRVRPYLSFHAWWGGRVLLPSFAVPSSQEPWDAWGKELFSLWPCLLASFLCTGKGWASEGTIWDQQGSAVVQWSDEKCVQTCSSKLEDLRWKKWCIF